MRRPVALAVVFVAAAAIAAPLFAGDVNLNVYPFAVRQLDKDFWEPNEDQYAIGGTVDFGKQGSPLHFALGMHGSAGTEAFSNPLIDDVTATVSELSFGIAKVWKTQGSTRPFLSGGLSFVHAEIDAGSVDADDEALGFWLETGVYWRLGAHFNLGLHARMLAGADVTLFDVDGDADYWQAGPMIGWSWPTK